MSVVASVGPLVPAGYRRGPRSDCCQPMRIGSTQAQVVRHLELGIAVGFMRPFPADEFNEDTTL